MAGTAVRISFLADAGPARKGLEDLASSASSASSKAENSLKGVDRALDGIDTSKARKSMEDLGESTDQTATKTGIMASALGAFADGLDHFIPGAGAYVTALQGAAVGVDVFSNVSDVATLALQSKYVAMVKDKAATIASGVATVATTTATKAAAAGQWLLNAALSANPIGLVVLAIAALVTGLIIAYKNSETFRNIVNGAFGAVKTGITALVGFFKNLGPNIAKAVGALGSLLTSRGRDVINGLAKGYNAAIGAVASFFRGIGSKVAGWVGGAASWLVRKGADIISGLAKGYVGAMVGVSSFFLGLGAKVVGWVGGMGSKLYNAGADLIRGFLNGISSMVGALVEKAKNVAGSAIDAVKNKLGIHSPSRVFAAIGRFLGLGLINGIDKTARAASNAAGRLAGAVTGGFGEVNLSAGMALSSVAGSGAGQPVVINVYALTDGPDVGKRVVSAIKDYETFNGTSWRTR
jgi:phage-related protein